MQVWQVAENTYNEGRSVAPAAQGRVLGMSILPLWSYAFPLIPDFETQT